MNLSEELLHIQEYMEILRELILDNIEEGFIPEQTALKLHTLRSGLESVLSEIQELKDIHDIKKVPGVIVKEASTPTKLPDNVIVMKDWLEKKGRNPKK